MLVEISSLLERGTTWFLRSRRLPEEMDVTIAHFKPGVEALSGSLSTLLDAGERSRLEAEVARLGEARVPAELARRVVSFDTLYATLDVAEVAANANKSVEPVAAIHFEVATRLGLPWLREKIAALPGDQHWQLLAKSAMQDDLSALQRSVTGEVLAGDLGSTSALIAAWADRNHRALERIAQLLTELRAVPAPDSAMLSVALRELRNLG
jgi:glutamate dehydrogenase